MIEQIVVGFEVDILVAERDVTRVLTVNMDADGFKMLCQTFGVGTCIEVVIAAFSMEWLGIEGCKGGALDDYGRDAKGLHDLVIEIGESLLAENVVAFDGLGHGDEVEKDATRRAMLFGEEEDGIIEQSCDGLLARLLENALPVMSRERSGESGDRIGTAEETIANQL